MAPKWGCPQKYFFLQNVQSYGYTIFDDGGSTVKVHVYTPPLNDPQMGLPPKNIFFFKMSKMIGLSFSMLTNRLKWSIFTPTHQCPQTGWTITINRKLLKLKLYESFIQAVKNASRHKKCQYVSCNRHWITLLDFKYKSHAE